MAVGGGLVPVVLPGVSTAARKPQGERQGRGEPGRLSGPWLLTQSPRPRRGNGGPARRHHGGVMYLLESLAGEGRTGPLQPCSFPRPP